MAKTVEAFLMFIRCCSDTKLGRSPQDDNASVLHEKKKKKKTCLIANIPCSTCVLEHLDSA